MYSGVQTEAYSGGEGRVSIICCINCLLYSKCTVLYRQRRIQGGGVYVVLIVYYTINVQWCTDRGVFRGGEGVGVSICCINCPPPLFFI